MEKNLVVDFYKVYSHDAERETEQTVNDLMAVWARLDKTVAKNPSVIRKGISFGMALAKCLADGSVKIHQPKKKPAAASVPDAEVLGY